MHRRPKKPKPALTRKAPRKPEKAPRRPAKVIGLRETVEGLKEALEGGNARIHENRDGSVDAEYRFKVTMDPEGDLDTIENEFPLVDRYWISVGWLFSLMQEGGAAGESASVRYKGRDAAFTYARLGRYKGDVFDAARMILETYRRTTLIFVEEIVIRLRYSPDGSRPGWTRARQGNGNAEARRKR